MAQRLIDKLTIKEQEEAQEPKRKKNAVNQIVVKDGSKDKQISAKINSATYQIFSKINKAQGISNNSALNMLINKYIRESSSILDMEK